MFGFFTTQVSKGELHSNMKYLQDLLKRGKEVKDKKIPNLGSDLTMYREITKEYKNAIKGDVIGFEESLVRGNAELKPYRSGWEIHISFPQQPFLEHYEVMTNKYNYPKKWAIPHNRDKKFTYRHLPIQIIDRKYSEPSDYYDSIHSNCRIYDCGVAYLLVGGHGDSLEEYTFVIEKTK